MYTRLGVARRRTITRSFRSEVSKASLGTLSQAITAEKAETLG